MKKKEFKTKEEKKMDLEDVSPKKVIRIIVLCIIVIFGLIVFFGSWYTVHVGDVAVVFNQMSGKTSSNTCGFHMKVPLVETVYKFDVKTQRLDIKAEGMSKDLQLVVVDVILNYHLTYEKVNELFTKVGIDYSEKIIVPAANEVIKAVIAQFPVENIVVERQKLREAIDKAINTRLATYDIALEATNIVDIDFAKEFNEVIEKKQIEEQKIKTAEYQKMQAKEYKEKTILEAEADARKQELMKTSLTQNIVSLEWIKKWDGKLPVTMLGDKTVMMITPEK
jgi:regulator of protease activity HflC (stomatin/prohibitin superfamily)